MGGVWHYLKDPRPGLLQNLALVFEGLKNNNNCSNNKRWKDILKYYSDLVMLYLGKATGISYFISLQQICLKAD